jgi:hypothetical protein
MRPDPRIPIILQPSAEALAAALAQGPPAALLLAASLAPPAGGVTVARLEAPRSRHSLACTCCGGRSSAAGALDRLFQARIRGRCPWFERVLACPAGDTARQELLAALREDVLTMARFRLAG